MSKYKRVTITSLAIVLSILFIGSTALCKPPDDKPDKEPPGKSELGIIITDSDGNEITEVTLTVGDTFQFKAKITGDDSIDTSQADVEWQVRGGIGDINPIDQFTATFKATKFGIGIVGASAKVDKKPLRAPCYVLVKVAKGEPPPGKGKRVVVTVTPDFVDLSPGGNATFTGEPDISGAQWKWQFVPPRIGDIEQDGNKCWFSAGANTVEE